MTLYQSDLFYVSRNLSLFHQPINQSTNQSSSLTVEVGRVSSVKRGSTKTTSSADLISISLKAGSSMGLYRQRRGGGGGGGGVGRLATEKTDVVPSLLHNQAYKSTKLVRNTCKEIIVPSHVDSIQSCSLTN